MRLDRQLDGLLREAERASGAMREAAWELEAIRDLLPDRGKSKVHRQQLVHTSRRLLAAADLLTAEVAALSPKSASWVAKIGRKALWAGGAIAIAATTGLGEGAGQAAFERYAGTKDRAELCLDAVEHEANGATQIVEHYVEDQLVTIAAALKEIAERDSEMAKHPAYEVEDWSAYTDPAIDRTTRLGYLIDRAHKLDHFLGPLEDYEADPDTYERVSVLRADIDKQGRSLNRLRTLLDTLE